MPGEQNLRGVCSPTSQGGSYRHELPGYVGHRRDVCNLAGNSGKSCKSLNRVCVRDDETLLGDHSGCRGNRT